MVFFLFDYYRFFIELKDKYFRERLFYTVFELFIIDGEFIRDIFF